MCTSLLFGSRTEQKHLYTDVIEMMRDVVRDKNYFVRMK